MKIFIIYFKYIGILVLQIKLNFLNESIFSLRIKYGKYLQPTYNLITS